MAQSKLGPNPAQMKKIGVLAVAMLISWGIFFVINKKPSSTTDSTSTQDTQTSSGGIKSLIPGFIKQERQSNLIENHQLGISLQYPDYFKYGIEASQTEGMVQLASFDINQYFDEFPNGLKVEIVKQENRNNLSLLDYAGQNTEPMGPSTSFKKVKYGNHTGYGRYLQENDISTLEVFLSKSNDVLIIYVIGSASEYNSNVNLLDQMFSSIEFI